MWTAAPRDQRDAGDRQRWDDLHGVARTWQRAVWLRCRGGAGSDAALGDVAARCAARWLRRHGPRIYSAVGGNDAIVVSGDLEFEFVDRHDFTATFSVRAGQRRRRYYRLTTDGTHVLAAQRRTWKEFMAAITRIAKVHHA